MLNTGSITSRPAPASRLNSRLPYRGPICRIGPIFGKRSKIVYRAFCFRLVRALVNGVAAQMQCLPALMHSLGVSLVKVIPGRVLASVARKAVQA